MNLIHNDTNRLTLELTCPFNWIGGLGLVVIAIGHLPVGATLVGLSLMLRLIEMSGFQGA